MKISTPATPGIKDDDGNVIHIKTVDLPGWDLTADYTTSVNVSGITAANIVSITGHVVKDDGSVFVSVPGPSNNINPAEVRFEVAYVPGTPMTVYVTISDLVTVLDWDSTANPRGKLFISYIPT